MSEDEPVSDELWNAHEAVRRVLMLIAPAVGGCVACAAYEYRIVREALDQLIEEAEDVAADSHDDAVH
jgi:hypothetical protein